MVYIGQVEYKMTEDDNWRNGWLVGECVDTANTLLDEDFNPVPKIKNNDEEFTCYDCRRLMFSGVMLQV